VDNDGNDDKATGAIPVELVTIQKKRAERRGDKELDVYRLINFNFEQASATDDHKRIITQFIRPNLKPDSRLEITGYTDAFTGDGQTNLTLSQRRADAIAAEIGTGQRITKGLGSRVQLYPNTTPEGRFYSRTVELRVETPVR